MARETIGQTFTVAFLLCVVCSVLVSGAAVVLRPTQEINKLLDKKRNILMAAGLAEEGRTIDELFERIDVRVVDLATGGYVDGIDPGTYDYIAAAGDPDQGVETSDLGQRAGIRRRAKLMPVYLVSRRGEVDKVILPIFGRGLWSTLYGFVALDRDDLNTIRSLVYYQHGETPGLGGEVDNPAWKAQWNGKRAFGDDGRVAIRIPRGAVAAGVPDAVHSVDGLSGATITSRGVQDMLHYWLGEEGYGPFLGRLRDEGEA